MKKKSMRTERGWGHGEPLPTPTEIGFEPIEDILDEAKRITGDERGRDYGHPLDNFTQIADMWSTYLRHPITARQVAWMCMLMKASRDSHSPKRDNLVDTAGYARCAQMVEDERVRRESPTA